MYHLILHQKGKDQFYNTWHTQDGHIFIFVESGDGSIVTRDKSYNMKPGTLCYIGKDKYHYTLPEKPREYVRSKLMLAGTLFETFIGTLESLSPDFADFLGDERVTVADLSGEEYTRVMNVFRYLGRLSENDKYSRAEILSAALQLSLILAKNENVTVQTNSGALQLAVKYINEHITEDISIDIISDKCYISKYYLCRLFKEKIGLTIMEYVLQTRIIMAMELLQKEDTPIAEIAIKCGFSSPSYFSRVFKKQTGISAIAYKRKNKRT
jgi:AraC-like DNA-binding protein